MFTCFALFHLFMHFPWLWDLSIDSPAVIFRMTKAELIVFLTKYALPPCMRISGNRTCRCGRNLRGNLSLPCSLCSLGFSRETEPVCVRGCVCVCVNLLAYAVTEAGRSPGVQSESAC